MRYIPHDDQSSVPALSPETEARLSEYAHTIATGAVRQDTTSHEGALALPFIDHSEDSARAREALRGIAHLIVVGIGGSSLGTEAVYDALRPEEGIELTVLDAVSPARLARLMHLLEKRGIPPAQLGVCLISKSGGTTETISNYAMLRHVLSEHFGTESEPRTVVVTDEGSKLDHVAEAAGYPRFHIPHGVGGRYSVFSHVGTVPLMLCGVDVAGLQAGARALMEDTHTIPMAMTSARTIAQCGPRGIIDTFLFDPELRSYGLWRRQLLGESLGKSVALDGTEAVYGPLPTVSTVGDLHSIAQLYLAGPRGIHTDFITEDQYDDAPFAQVPPVSIVPQLAGKSAQDVTSALEESVRASYADRGLAYAEYRITARTPHELGALMAFNMFETMLAASMMGVDAFDQPNVELYKNKMRAALERPR